MTAMDDDSLRARHIRIEARPDGTGQVHIDGHNIASDVRGLTLTARAGQMPSLVLDLNPRHDPTVVQGLAHVVVGEAPEPDPGPAAAAFLAAIDPAALEQAALAQPLGAGPSALTRAMLDVLITWAEGRTL